MIYAIRAKGTKFVKFGVAKDVGKRLMAHQVSCPLELEIIATADWPHTVEAKIHNLLRPLCVRGEWFRYEALAVKIVRVMLDGKGADALVEVVESHLVSIPRLDAVTRYAIRMGLTAP